MRRYILFLLLLGIYGIARGQEGYDYRYWFDNDYSTVSQGHATSEKWQVEIDLDGLDGTLHTLHMQVVDGEGAESAPMTRFFLKTHDASVEQGYYWFDGDYTTRKASQTQGAFFIDVSGLADGFHTICYQVAGKDDALSSVVTRQFFKITIPESVNYRCWVDNDLSTMFSGQVTGEPMLVDVSHVSDGFHFLHVQLEGVESSVVSRPFIKIPQTDDVEYLKCLCYMDDEFYLAEDVPSAGGVLNWSIDVSSLSEGMHHILIQVVTPSGAATATYEADFLRTPINEEAGISNVIIVDGAEQKAYRLNGQPARATDKGLLIIKGKKFIAK